MEGGYGEDPYDPGGPTNQGITLAVLAAWKGVTLDATNHGELKQELKRIAPETVRKIYRTRYWGPAACAELSAPLALMHFDAAVNHGVGAALRMLQEAAGTEIDGEVGPLTRAAIAAKPPDGLIRAYADIRRARYRSLPHFWRFGRGWLSRASKTEARALALLDGTTSTEAQRQKGPSPMQNDTTTLPGGKWWGQSLTVWGALITALSTLAPAPCDRRRHLRRPRAPGRRGCHLGGAGALRSRRHADDHRRTRACGSAAGTAASQHQALRDGARAFTCRSIRRMQASFARAATGPAHGCRPLPRIRSARPQDGRALRRSRAVRQDGWRPFCS